MRKNKNLKIKNQNYGIRFVDGFFKKFVTLVTLYFCILIFDL
jgi:hypothetical protein